MDMIDSSQMITINVIVPEGFATIENLAYPESAMVGESVSISFDMRNAGYDDALFAKVTGPAGPQELFRGIVASGGIQPVSFSMVMPATSLTLTIETGHEE